MINKEKLKNSKQPLVLGVVLLVAVAGFALLLSMSSMSSDNNKSGEESGEGSGQSQVVARPNDTFMTLILEENTERLKDPSLPSPIKAFLTADLALASAYYNKDEAKGYASEALTLIESLSEEEKAQNFPNIETTLTSLRLIEEGKYSEGVEAFPIASPPTPEEPSSE